jgi:hypothetical protein
MKAGRTRNVLIQYRVLVQDVVYQSFAVMVEDENLPLYGRVRVASAPVYDRPTYIAASNLADRIEKDCCICVSMLYP